MRPFISEQDLADYLRRDDVASEPAATQCVDSACDTIRDETSQILNEVLDDTILLDGSGTDAIMVPELPVLALSAVLLDDEAVTDYVLHDSGILAHTTGFWTTGRGNIEITYDHGYEDDAVPSGVRIVALRLAARLFNQPEGVVFESLGARSVRYDSSPGDLTEDEKRRLRKAGVYKQPWATVVAS